jgi:hypothetical protein
MPGGLNLSKYQLERGSYMQDRFVGDIGDFGKYGLLNFICGNGDKTEKKFKLGINWYLFRPEPNDREMKLSHGQFTNYLIPSKTNDREFKICEPNLYCKLQKIVNANQRKVAEIEAMNILSSKSVFISKHISYNKIEASQKRLNYRYLWIKESISKL